jgi:uncharacterized protein YjbI with pentapeptide repeats/transcriptional regulator with XRE-family HTH domain
MGRSCQASKQGVEKAKAAIKVKGWTQEYLAGAAGCSRPIVNKFFARRPVEMRLFQTICTELSLEWDEIAELESESEQLNGADKDKIIQEPSGTTQVLTDKKSYAFAIAGTVSPEDIAKLKAIIALIQKVSQDSSITIVDIERGSIKLILEGSQEGLERLENLFRSGQLEDVLGVSIEDVEFVTLPNSNPSKKRLAFTIAGDVPESEIAILKAALAETSDDTVEQSENQNPISRSNPISLKLVFVNLIRGNLGGSFRIFRNLIRADLRNANLRSTYLNNANLSDTNFSGANLSGTNLRSSNLSNANLSNANLSNANLFNANLIDANLSGANLIDTNLSHANLFDANLSHANLFDANLRSAKLIGLKLSNANLSNANLSNANLSNANLSNANLSNANLSNANLFDANLSFADLTDANLSHAILSCANLRYANLRRANLKHAILIGVIIDETTIISNKWRLVWEIVNQASEDRDLSYTDLIDTNLSGVNLSGVSLSGADLGDANLSLANLSLANLSLANLGDANLSLANLSLANLGDANLSLANLSLANLSDANLSDANLSDANLSGANLSGANLSGTIVANAYFGRGKGLTKDMKENLKQRGAIFSNRPPVLNPTYIPQVSEEINRIFDS